MLSSKLNMSLLRIRCKKLLNRYESTKTQKAQATLRKCFHIFPFFYLLFLIGIHYTSFQRERSRLASPFLS